MNTDDLIASMGAGLSPVSRNRLTQGVLAGLGCGLGMTAVAFALFWGIRPDVGIVLRDVSLFAKTALPLALACLAWPWLMAQARPGAMSRAARLSVTVPVVLLVLVVAALLFTPPDAVGMAVRGKSVNTCLVSIPVLAVPILAGLLAMLRRGAPDRPGRCGAVAGLLAGGLSATVYSLYCVEDSALFYGLWYTLGVLVVCGCGALAGRLALRW
ncbi:hypothetical protein SAMN04488003_1068 [Loktanella fryxellensis]|uniref:DUF1109 domain-containing protein n=1 Tax=Loktanella fryxellensis TaxID=245187 RepID=A0A1H8C032_9RHOB|nr:DUF1109 domain-containing protein [Loktanella fryxellensis]SEM88541.1 hypothetical protein SAMN04488003_1068 [Loktanella fryxellensis]